MNDSITTILDTARRIANTDLYPARCRSVITDLANAFQTASVELTESREYAIALERELADRSEKQDAFTAMASSMYADFEMTNASLAGCKIAIQQAWASSRERAARITALTEVLTELHAMVVGECPSLLNEDSGGNGELSCQINDILTGEITMKNPAGKASDVLLEHIVYYDLVERRGEAIADAVIDELVEIGVKSVITTHPARPNDTTAK